VAGDQDEVGLLQVIDPVQQEFPQRVDALSNEALSF